MFDLTVDVCVLEIKTIYPDVLLLPVLASYLSTQIVPQQMSHNRNI